MRAKSHLALDSTARKKTCELESQKLAKALSDLVNRLEPGLGTTKLAGKTKPVNIKWYMKAKMS